jgi:hypothetical protein
LAFTFQHQRQPAPFNNLLGIFIWLEIYWFVPSKNFWGFFSTFLGLDISFSTLAYSLFFCSISSRQSGSIPIDVFECWPLFAQDTGRA